MKIDEVEELERQLAECQECRDMYAPQTVIEALRAEAWYPIEDAEEMGVRDGQRVLLQEGCDWFQGFYRDFWRDTRGAQCFPSHFKRITPPEN